MAALVDASPHKVVEDDQPSDDDVWHPIIAKTDNTYGRVVDEATNAVMDGQINIDHDGHDMFGGFTATPVSESFESSAARPCWIFDVTFWILRCSRRRRIGISACVLVEIEYSSLCTDSNCR